MVAQAEKSASTVQNCKASATWVGTYNRVLGRQYGRFPSNHLRLPLARWAGHSGAARSRRQSTMTGHYGLCHSGRAHKKETIMSIRPPVRTHRPRQRPQGPNRGDWWRPPAPPECPAHLWSGFRRCTDGVTPQRRPSTGYIRPYPRKPNSPACAHTSAVAAPRGAQPWRLVAATGAPRVPSSSVEWIPPVYRRGDTVAPPQRRIHPAQPPGN